MNTVTLSPSKIKKLSHEALQLEWRDGKESILSAELLRRSCPCAECREKQGDSSHQSPLTPKKSMLTIVESSREEELFLEKVWSVGNYAIGLQWGDGHKTGIYTYQYLYQLGQENRQGNGANS